LALFVIYALLAVPFRSYVQPFVIMAAIPFGLVGAVVGHILLGYSLSLMSLFGLVALSGVVVNDSLVLVDFANRSRRNGLSAHGAIVAAGAQRFRPIMLTTLTTFGGLAPMIFETSRQARFMIPMAISLGFGILFATLITLGLVPTFYLVVEDLRELLSGQSRPNEP
jgi:multidrug efflux pump subunit AcrB